MPDDIDPFDGEELHFAAQNGDLQRVKELLAEGVEINSFDKDTGWTPLHGAVVSEQMDVVKFLLESGADVNAYEGSTDKIGNTPLGQIADECSFEIVKILIAAGADIDIPGWMNITARQLLEKRSDKEGKKIQSLLE